jgi:hypothetical protein
MLEIGAKGHVDLHLKCTRPLTPPGFKENCNSSEDVNKLAHPHITFTAVLLM